ncbi:DUF2840 domain-containing protein [Pseudoxanthomonas suwonensis]|uniref:DUF2840 domain-containing protein n=1 Tax=Pseudoxanthomonas suwonensis TaxID=314722 RepID=UPI00069707B3|nr:DUF2840 domain-containing protein [Pseudoxanthomonas suwonensis]
MNAQPHDISAPPPPRENRPQALSSDAPLTRVALVHVPRLFVVSLRFGRPVRELALDGTRRIAAFLPGARFARLRWEADDWGPSRWQLLVLQAGTLREPLQRIHGIDPGVGVLLRAEGPREVRAVLPKIDAIASLGIDPADAAPAYWRLLGERLAARHPLPDYTAARHAVWQSGRTLQ